jgi:hypothetical protein
MLKFQQGYQEASMMNANRVCIVTALLCLVVGSASAAPTMTSLAPSKKTVAKGEAVTFIVKGEGLDNAVCALRISYGDGSSTIRHMDWGKNVQFPLGLKKTYQKAGKYTARVIGVKSGNVLKCLGSGQASVLVTAPPSRPEPESAG